MSQEYYILNLLNIEDKNIKLVENFYKIEKFGNIKYKVIEATLSYEPPFCSRCGCVFNDIQTYEKNGFKSSDILLLDICGHGCILRLKKQRFLCHSCNKKFFAETSMVNKGCFISNSVKYAIALDLKNKISEKDIAKDIKYPLILLKELLILIMMVKNFINIIYPKFFLLMNLNPLSQLMVL